VTPLDLKRTIEIGRNEKENTMEKRNSSIEDVDAVTAIETEIPALAEAIGVKPEELLSTVTGGELPNDCTCCTTDRW
jgi:hypothetical protein